MREYIGGYMGLVGEEAMELRIRGLVIEARAVAVRSSLVRAAALLRAVRAATALLDGSQPIDLPGAIMVLNHALGGVR